MQYERGNGSRLLTAGAGLKQSAYMRTLILITFYKIIIIFRCTFCNVFFLLLLELLLSFWVTKKKNAKWIGKDTISTKNGYYQPISAISNWCIALAFSFVSWYPWRGHFGIIKYKILYFIQKAIQEFVSFKQCSRTALHFIFTKSDQPLILWLTTVDLMISECFWFQCDKCWNFVWYMKQSKPFDSMKNGLAEHWLPVDIMPSPQPNRMPLF